jgi:hypothetical protein
LSPIATAIARCPVDRCRAQPSIPTVRDHHVLFEFKLERADGSPADPPSYTTAVCVWKAGDTIPLGAGRSLRAIEVR